MALVAAVALLLQSFAVQTHIHSASDEIGGVFRSAGHTAAPAQSPLDKAAGCPLCQAIVHAGVFVAPSVPLVYLPFSWVGVARPVFAVPSEPAGVVHDWRSRAPPRG
jgi:hypothetical protein